MAKRGVGKFNSDLDAAIYSLSLDGGADEEASYGEGGGFYGLMRNGAEIAEAIEERRRFAPEEVEGVDSTELDFLREDGKAGVIFYERSDGIVEVSYYKSAADLDKDWKEVEAETASDDDDFEQNRARRRNSKLSDVSSKYGAPMGRPSKEVSGNVTLELVRMVDGDYDSGGAYWGSGEPLWRAQDEDGDEQFFRAKDRAAAKAKLAEQGATVVRGSSERQNEGEDSKLETDGTLAQLLEAEAESADLPSEYWRQLEVTPELSKVATQYEDALWQALSELVSKYPPKGDADANVLMEDGDAPYLVFQTLSGAGIGIWDGSWDEFYDDDVIKEKVKPFLRAKLGRWVNESAIGIEAALMNAVYENEKRLGIERDEDGNIIEQEENGRRPKHRRNGSQPWIVLLNGEQTDVVFFAEDMDADDVKRSLVDHDGYDPRITVKKRERRRTHAPDELAMNGEGFSNITEIKAANKAVGGHWFDPGSLRFFRSRIESKVYGGKYFVSSEQQEDDSERRFTVREALPDGHIKTVGKFQGYRFKEDAVDAIKEFLKTPSRVPNGRPSPRPSL